MTDLKDSSFDELNQQDRERIAKAFMIPEQYGDKYDAVRDEIRKALTCQICGQPKVHYRLYGYRCSNPEHAEQERVLRQERRL